MEFQFWKIERQIDYNLIFGCEFSDLFIHYNIRVATIKPTMGKFGVSILSYELSIICCHIDR